MQLDITVGILEECNSVCLVVEVHQDPLDQAPTDQDPTDQDPTDQDPLDQAPMVQDQDLYVRF